MNTEQISPKKSNRNIGNTTVRSRAARMIPMLGEAVTHRTAIADERNDAERCHSPMAQSASQLVGNPEFQQLLCQALTVVVAQIGGEQLAPTAPDVDAQVRRASPRQRAAALRQRMMRFSTVYNAGWHIRYCLHGDPKRLAEAAAKFCEVIANEIASATDKEALIYAIADTVTCSPYGVPWEG